jgi:hypothetical protein
LSQPYVVSQSQLPASEELAPPSFIEVDPASAGTAQSASQLQPGSQPVVTSQKHVASIPPASGMSGAHSDCGRHTLTPLEAG